MINLFINGSQFGQTMGMTFHMDGEGSLAQRRLTSTENVKVVSSIYGREVDADKIAQLVKSGLADKVAGYTKALEVESIRVNSLNMLVRELETVKASDIQSMITCYVPDVLLRELTSMRVKYYLSGESVNDYYSEFELSLWRKAMPLFQELFFNLVFANIASCGKNQFNDPVQEIGRAHV